MIRHYKRTHLEDFVEQLYIQHEILSPADITISNISTRMSISVEYIAIKHMKGASFRAGSKRFIILLDKFRSKRQQRIDFFHELGHLLRHAGNQLVMPSLFIEYQEADTEQFTLYALMPISMIKRLELSPDRKQAIIQLAEAFTVGTELASKRYDQIMRREIEGVMIAESAAAWSPRKEVKPRNVSEPQYWVYYDPTGTMDGPSQMIVILDEWTLTNQREVDLPIGERLSEIDPDEALAFDGAAVHQSDLICWDGRVTLQINELLRRYGISRNVFIIQMNQVEMLINREQELTRRMVW